MGYLLGTRYETVESHLPILISHENDWAKVSTSSNSGFDTKNDSSLWAWGNEFLGDKPSLDGLKPLQSDLKWKNIKCVNKDCAFLDEFDRVWKLEGNKLVPLDQNTWKQMIFTQNINIGLQNNGEVYTWGWNHMGELGIGISGFKEHPQKVDLQTPIKSIDLGFQTVMAIGEDKACILGESKVRKNYSCLIQLNLGFL